MGCADFVDLGGADDGSWVAEATGAMVIEEEGKPEVVSMTEGEIMTRLRELKVTFEISFHSPC